MDHANGRVGRARAMGRVSLQILASAVMLLVAPGTICSQGDTPADTRLVGRWEGALQVGAIQLRVAIDVAAVPSGGYSATFDSIDQAATGLPVDAVSLEGSTVKFTMARLHMSFEGELAQDGLEIAGIFTQGAELPLTLKKVEQATRLRRPQEPVKPYPYREAEVAYSHDPEGDIESSFEPEGTPENKSRITLAGTLTLPEGEPPFPAAILISGSGPQDRDEALLGHRPFLVLADHLTRRGIAVLRYDDRGVASSTGSMKNADTHDFARDAHAGLLYLKTRTEIDADKIGLIGHSEGGLIAPLVAAKTKDVAYIVLLAGPGVSGEEILMLQGRLLAKAGGASEGRLADQEEQLRLLYSVLREEKDAAERRSKFAALLKESYEDLGELEQKALGSRDPWVQQQVAILESRWFRVFVAHDPRSTLGEVKCPVLAINGEKDLQVDADQNLPEIEKALAAAGNQDVTTVKLDGLNHLFQTCVTGAPSQYGKIEETFAPLALKTVADWIAERFLGGR